MARHDVELTLTVDKCGDGLGRDFMGVGRLGSGARSWDMCAFFHLVALPAKSENRNRNCEQGPRIPKSSSLSG